MRVQCPKLRYLIKILEYIAENKGKYETELTEKHFWGLTFVTARVISSTDLKSRKYSQFVFVQPVTEPFGSAPGRSHLARWTFDWLKNSFPKVT